MRKPVHVMLLITQLGSGFDAPMIEIAATKFDPETGEIGPDLLILLNVKQALRMGRATAPNLTSFMMARKYDIMVLENPEYITELADAVKKLRAWLTSDEVAGGQWENLLVYNHYPAYQLPHLAFIDAHVLSSDDTLWPSYGVRCAKTLGDLARPLLVDQGIDLPNRPPSHKGAADECHHQAIVAMHSLRAIEGRGPLAKPESKKTTVKVVNAAQKPVVLNEEDDEEI